MMQPIVANPDRLFDYDVVDSAGQRIGDIDNIWVDQATGQTAFFGAKASGLLGGTYVLPFNNAQIDDNRHLVVIPYALDQIKKAPGLSGGDQLNATDEQKIRDYYSGLVPQVAAPAPNAVGGPATNVPADAAASARAAASGAVNTAESPLRFRKIARTEKIYVPVEVQREYVVPEGQPVGQDASYTAAAPANADQRDDRINENRDPGDRPPADAGSTVPLKRD